MSGPPHAPDFEPEDEAIAKLKALNAEMLAALKESINAADSHYNHFDREGTHGANCPACIARREANAIARTAITNAEGRES